MRFTASLEFGHFFGSGCRLEAGLSGFKTEIGKKEIKAEARYDGKWVLRTNMELPAEEIALKYKRLWMVEDIFRTMKSILDTRPTYHKCTETIRGHVFRSFLALCLRKEVANRLASKGSKLEWKDIVRDLNELQEMQTVFSGKSFILRSQLKGCTHQVLQAVGVAAPPTVREMQQRVQRKKGSVVPKIFW